MPNPNELARSEESERSPSFKEIEAKLDFLTKVRRIDSDFPRELIDIFWDTFARKDHSHPPPYSGNEVY